MTNPGNSSLTRLCLHSHIIFLAGAEALLDPKVAELLRCFNIDAPTLQDRFISSSFQYIVVDPDQTLKSNYCDLVLANRVTKRLLEGQGFA
jgi:hypothetical protein